MAMESKPTSRPLVWLALLLTLCLVYWQWSQEDAALTPAADVTIANVARPASVKRETPAMPRGAEPEVATSPMQVNDVKTNSANINDAKLTSEKTRLPAEATRPQPAQQGDFTRPLPSGRVSHVLFAAHEWTAPPPKPQAPPPPEAPPLPYTYVGSMQEMPEGNTLILMQQKKMLLPKVGSQVNAQWRLDREDAQSVYFTYLPLNQAVVLSKTKTATLANQRQSLSDADNNPSDEMLNQ
ncbi:hypothetical protein [Methylophilus medardicus]|uniref:Secretion system X translation initiation factor n=1 Tax=Methylophilus medardicus TaxID=2588534 RepID=A0A5B8CTN2_9PROT|nr:hypothetical protein [Methylophilus medardicus]QDC44694.1 hypothetical protein FIU01_09225 [Methylophilus medardicus]QDC49701.1 hypothetical protein FIU00_09225 [Methylophilus medardicus]QDC53406.1 hypothetical protein FIT99_09225 [Methylophilus medardicus]